MSAITRTCHECGRAFDIDEDEQAFLQSLGRQQGRPFVLPSRCLPCRQFRRQEQFGPPAIVEPGNDETLPCSDCGESFVFARAEQEWFAARRFARPRRCRPCRRAHVRHFA